MKILLLIGGLMGFCVGMFFSWAEESSGSSCLWHACLAAYLAAVMMRWWGEAWRKSLASAMREQQTRAQAAAPPIFSKASKS
jgi:nitrate/nitrite transporter NarK